MSLLNALRQAVKTQLEAIPNIGVVHARVRYAPDAASFRALYTATIDGMPQVRGWAITVVQTELAAETFGRPVSLGGRVVLELLGWQGLDDAAASDEALVELAEQVLVRLADADLAVPGAYARVLTPNLTQVAEVMFAGVLCHRVTIACPVLVGESARW